MKWMAFVAAVLFAAGTAEAQVGGAGDYSILQRESIFLPGRFFGAAPAPRARPQAIRAPVLIGVLLDHRESVAFLNVWDSRGNVRIVKLRKGDVIDWNRSVVREITMQGIAVSAAEGGGLFIPPGNDIQNRPAAPEMLGFGSQTDRMVVADEPLPRGSQDDLANRMRTRRQIELNAGR